MIVDQLIFGTARLTGGATAREAAQIVRVCVVSGIRRFDTAPSYGLGTAEQVLGDALVGVSDVRISTKVGIARPSYPRFRTWLRWGKGLVKARSSPFDATFTPTNWTGEASRIDCSPATMQHSFDTSRRLLRRDVIETLFLHDPGREDIAAALPFLQAQQKQGAVNSFGIAIGTLLDTLPVTGSRSGLLTQAATPLGVLTGVGATLPDRLHSIVKTARFLAHRDDTFARARAALAALVPATVADVAAATIAADYALAHAYASHCGLLFATIRPDRLRAFLRAIHHLDQIGSVSPPPLS